jgi:hypothetical protein
MITDVHGFAYANDTLAFTKVEGISTKRPSTEVSYVIRVPFFQQD